MVAQKKEADRAGAHEAISGNGGAEAHAKAGASHTAAAGVLAVLVVAALAYGLVETAIRAVALFTA